MLSGIILKGVLVMQEREKFKNRMGFVIVSVACAVGLGNIWLLPYRAGAMGGGFYVLTYLFFAFFLAIPVLMTEYAVGRGAQTSASAHYQVLEPKGTKWHYASYMSMAGHYLLLMFYMVIVGFSLAYLWKGLTGSLIGASPEEIGAAFGSLTGDPVQSTGYMLAVVVAAFLVCTLGLQKGIEKIGKYMMLIFFTLLIILIGRSLTLPGALEGIRFIFIPDFEALAASQYSVFTIIHMAMSQALFSLSVGMGSMAVFGSFIGRDRALFGEAATVGIIDISVSLLCLLMVFPAAFAFGIAPGAGPGLIFVTMPNIFNAMPLSYIWSLTFYIGLFFVAFSTGAAVCESIITMSMDKFGWVRKKSAIINLMAVCLLCMPAVLGWSVWSHIRPLGVGNFGAFFTFLVMENILPLGALVYLLFCMTKKGWGYENFMAEVNAGDGIKFPQSLRFYMTYVIPIAIIFIFVFGHINRWIL